MNIINHYPQRKETYFSNRNTTSSQYSGLQVLKNVIILDSILLRSLFHHSNDSHLKQSDKVKLSPVLEDDLYNIKNHTSDSG